MEWGCPAKCDQKQTPVVQGCDGRFSGMSQEDLWDGVQPHYTSLLGDQWWDKLLGVTWLLHQCPFSLLCVCCSSGKQHRPTPSAACGPSCVSVRSTQSMDPPLAFQDPAKTWWVLKQKTYDSLLACFVICQSLCLMFRGEAQAAWRCQSARCSQWANHPLMLKTSNSWITGECFLYRRLHVGFLDSQLLTLTFFLAPGNK